MTLDEQAKKTETHSIKVTKFIDWTYQLTKAEGTEDILKSVDFNTIIDEINVPCGEPPMTIWEVDHRFTMGLPAVVTVQFEKGCGGEMWIGINGKPQYLLNEGEWISFQIEHLKTIEISCDGEGEGGCKGIFEIEIDRDLFLSSLYHAQVQCFISNQEGIPHEAKEFPPITCSEVPNKYGRDSINLTLPDWNTIQLQRVRVTKMGFVIFKFFSNNDCIFTTNPIPFNAIDKVLLIAPKNTKVECQVLEAYCQVDETAVSENSLTYEIKFSITLYQRIMTVEQVIVEVEGKFCYPRKDFSSPNISF